MWSSVPFRIAVLLLGVPLVARAQLAWPSTTLRVAADPTTDRVAVVFPYRNTGARPVAIRRVESSCQCTVATPVPQSCAPGADGEICAVLRYAERTGLIRQKLAVFIGESAEPAAVLTLEVEVPERLHLGTRFLLWARDTAPVPQTVSFAVRAGDLLRPIALEVEPVDAFRAELRPRATTDVTDPTAQFEIVVTPRHTTRPVLGRLGIVTNEPGGPCASYGVSLAIK